MSQSAEKSVLTRSMHVLVTSWMQGKMNAAGYFWGKLQQI